MTDSRTQHRAARLDPRKPLVLDTRELGRRPGSMREVRVAVPAPAGIGLVDLIGVPEGAELGLELRFESVMDGVLVTAAVTAPVVGECGRCLAPLSDVLHVRLQELFAYPGAQTGVEADEDQSEMQGDLLDLEPALRDAVVLALPLNPLCREDCEGLCVDCGEPLAELPDDHAHDAVDPRWAALHGITLSGSTQHASTGATTQAIDPEEN